MVVGDEESAVRRNLELGAASLGVSSEQLCFARQVHGRAVLTLSAGTTAAAALQQEADAVVSAVAGLACAVRTADCVPVLVGDRLSGAVAAIHAGWRGVEVNVVEAAVSRLRELIGGDGQLVAAIGPHISVKAFEVSREVAKRLANASPVPGVVDESRGNPHVDMELIVRGQLQELGIGPDCVERVGSCTVGDPERCFSFRRDGACSGRHLHAIVVRG